MTIGNDSNRPVLAVILKLSASFCLMVMASLVKNTSDAVPPGEAVFFRSALSIPLILIWLSLCGQLRQGLSTRRPEAHLVRGLLGTLSMGLTFAALGLIPLPEVTAINFAVPIFTLCLSALILSERIRMVRISAVALGLIGVLVILWPRLDGAFNMGATGATLGMFMALGATFARSTVQIHLRHISKTEHPTTIVFYFALTATLISLCTIPFGWVMPAPDILMQLLLAGLTGFAAQLMLTTAYRFAPASMLAPYDYSTMIFAIIIGYVWFSELPTLSMLAGASLVIVANTIVIWRESQLRRRQETPPSQAAPTT